MEVREADHGMDVILMDVLGARCGRQKLNLRDYLELLCMSNIFHTFEVGTNVHVHTSLCGRS